MGRLLSGFSDRTWLGLSIDPASAADSLTFPNNACASWSTGIGPNIACANSSFINQSYGDTASVNVTYQDVIAPPGTTLRWWDTDYNNLVGVAWGTGGDANSHARIEIDPLGTDSVTLNSLDLGAWPNTSRDTNLQVKDLSTNTILFSFTGAVGVQPANTATHFNINVTSANGLAIEWFNSAFNVGIDNIDFTVAAVSGVPEPSTYAFILGLALAGMTYARRRASRS